MPSCAGQQRGGLVPILLGFETTYGVTPGTPAMVQVPYLNESLSGSRAQNTSEVLDGRRDPSRSFQGNTDVQGTVSVPIEKRYFGYWLKGLMGDPTTSGAGPYTHVFKIDSVNCLPSMFIEKQMTDIPRYYLYNGLKINSMSFSVSGDGELTASMDLVGSASSDSAATQDAGPITLSYEQYKFSDATIDEGGVANGDFTEITFEAGNNLDTEVYAIGDGGFRSALPEGKMSLGGSGTLLYDDQTIYDKAKNATKSAINVTFTSGTESLEFDMPEIEYSLNDPQVDGNDGVTLDLDFQAFFDTDAADSALVITLINDVADYATIPVS